ncbi:MAG TPA: PH domain-containing protein [Ktedonobacteraceae bacterium]|nr:PH domain-containing protein [Ktedonobacteraceae bacterium]
MSSKAPQAQQAHNDPFTPRREHGGYWRARKVGKGKNRHWEFKGRHQDEVVKTVLRKSKIFLITPAIPFIASVIGLMIVGALFGINPGGDSFWVLLEIIMLVLVIITGVYFAYHDLALWWVETYIITNQRVLIWKGLLSPSRDEFGVDRVVQVASDQGFMGLLLNFGNVHLYLVGGKEPILAKIHNPKAVRDLFEKVTDEYKRSKPAKETAPTLEPKNTELQDALVQLSQKEEPPTLPNPDEKYERYHKPGRVRGPLRTFGGPLRLPCNVKYNGDEYTVKYIQRARSVLIGKYIIPVLIFVGLIIALFYFPALSVYIGIGILIMIFVFIYIFINYWDDIYILTSKRVIDINRKFIFLDEEHLSIEYGQIKDVRVQVSNPIYIALDVGKVIVETPGNNPDLTMRVVDHPFAIQDMVYTVKGHKEKVDKIKSSNERKDQLNQWFGTVISTMEKNVLGKGVPYLITKNLFDAADIAGKLGMKVVPVGEDSSYYPDVDPGLIVSQNPLPGTLLVEMKDSEGKPLKDSKGKPLIPVIHVVLSRRP